MTSPGNPSRDWILLLPAHLTWGHLNEILQGSKEGNQVEGKVASSPTLKPPHPLPYDPLPSPPLFSWSHWKHKCFQCVIMWQIKCISPPPPPAITTSALIYHNITYSRQFTVVTKIWILYFSISPVYLIVYTSIQSILSFYIIVHVILSQISQLYKR